MLLERLANARTTGQGLRSPQSAACRRSNPRCGGDVPPHARLLLGHRETASTKRKRASRSRYRSSGDHHRAVRVGDDSPDGIGMRGTGGNVIAQGQDDEVVIAILGVVGYDAFSVALGKKGGHGHVPGLCLAMCIVERREQELSRTP